jgi:transcriptional regulator with XRE-family HTH domain
MPSQKRQGGTHEIGDRIREVVNSSGLGVAKFAHALGFSSHSKLSAWISGKTEPNAEALRAIATKFGVTADWLLGVPGAPQWSQQRRSDADLAADLAAYVSKKALASIDTTGEPWLRESIEGIFLAPASAGEVSTGESLLSQVTALATADLEKNANALRSVMLLGRIQSTADSIFAKAPSAHTKLTDAVSRLYGLQEFAPGPAFRFRKLTAKRPRRGKLDLLR